MEVNEPAIIIRKILVKCPPCIDDTFNVFPFLIALSEEFPKAEISLINEVNCSLAYNFLPFKVNCFERPIDKKSLIQTHHFCANLNDLFNIDLYFDLENTFNSAFMGYNFRATERVGFENGWNKYFLTKRFMNPGEINVEIKCLRLLALYIGKTHQNLKISRVRAEGEKVVKVEQLFLEPEPPKFIMVMLDNFKNVSAQVGMWTKFFDSFQNQKFIIWSQDNQDLISELFASVDLGVNSLYMHTGTNAKELVYLFNKVKGVVSNNIWSEGLCNYFGVSAVTFLNSELRNLPEYHHFYFKPQRFVFQETGSIKYTHQEEIRELGTMNQVVDHIHFSFKL